MIFFNKYRPLSGKGLFVFSSTLIIALFQKSESSNRNAIKFAPLPKPTDYKLKAVNNEELEASSLKKIASGIANILRDKPPYEIINDVLTSKSNSNLTKQIIEYETPMIVLAAFSLLFAVCIPIVGMIVCICRYAGKCGGRLENTKDLDVRPTKKRKRFTLALVLCCIFLITGSVIILVSSAGMTNSLPKTRKTVNNVFDDIFIYKSNTFQELNHILGSEVLQVLAEIIKEVIKLGVDIANPIIEKGKPIVNDLLTSLNNLSQALIASLQLLENINNNVKHLVNEGDQINQQLQQAKKNISDAKTSCTGSQCNEIPDSSVLNNEANFTQVPNITHTSNKVQGVVESNLTQEAEKGKKNFESLPNTVDKLASNFTSDFRNFSDETQKIKIDILRPWEDKINEMLNKTLLPYKDKLNDILKPESDLTTYDGYRNTVYIITSVMVLLVVLMILTGLVLGMIGASTFDTPSTRGDLSDIGGRILIGSAVVGVFVAFVINIVVAVVFLIGTNTAIVCRTTPNYELLKNTVDSPEVSKVFSLSKLIFKKDDGLKFTSLLSECERREAIWTAMKLDESLFNLTSALNYRDKLPDIDSVFKDLNNTVTNTTVITSKAKQSVDDSHDAGVQNINFTKYHEQTDKPIVQVSLSEFAANVSKAANNTPPNVKPKLEATADALVNLDNNIVKSSKTKSEELKKNVQQLEVQANKIVTSVNEIAGHLERIEKFLTKDALAIAWQGVTKHAHVVFEDIDMLITHVMSQVRNDVGRCHPVNNMYQSLMSDVCHDYFGNLNESWIGFGLCTLFTLITIILCVRAAKHFRRVHLTETIRDSDKWDSKIEMPWDTGFEMKDQQTLIH